MEIGIRDLKANLSRHLRRVKAGATIRITDRGRTIATIQPVQPTPNLAWAHRMVAEGKAKWNGGKPKGSASPIRLRPGEKTTSEIIVEGRG